MCVPIIEAIQHLLQDLTQSHKCEPYGTKGRVRINKVSKIHVLDTMNVCSKCHSNPSVEIFQSGPKWWTDRQANIAITRGMLLKLMCFFKASASTHCSVAVVLTQT